MIITLFLIVAYLWIHFTAKVDAEHLNKQEYINNHASRLAARILTGVIVGIFSPVAGICLGLLFWTLFDTILNRFRNKPWFYVGSVAETDKFFKNKYRFYFLTKIISLTIVIILLIKYGL